MHTISEQLWNNFGFQIFYIILYIPDILNIGILIAALILIFFEISI